MGVQLPVPSAREAGRTVPEASSGHAHLMSQSEPKDAGFPPVPPRAPWWGRGLGLSWLCCVAPAPLWALAVPQTAKSCSPNVHLPKKPSLGSEEGGRVPRGPLPPVPPGPSGGPRGLRPALP